MDIAKKVFLYLEITRLNPGADLDKIAEKMVQEGLSSEDAEALIAFVPMAFGYVLLSSNGVTLSDSFQVLDPTTGKKSRGFLIDQPIFQAAVETANKMFENLESTERAYEIAMMSAEFSAASKLSPDGKSLEKLVLTEAVLTRLPGIQIVVALHIGQKVKLVSTGEVEIIVWLWTDPDTGAEDAYVASFGKRFPQNLPENKPYILRHFTSSLEELKEV